MRDFIFNAANSGNAAAGGGNVSFGRIAVTVEGRLDLKQEEQDRYRMTPHPVEFDMYYSC